MNIIDAIPNMKNGYKLKRKDWASNTWLVLLDGQDYIWRMVTNGAPIVNATVYIFSAEDLQATDWVAFNR